jgi:hypothetical protein
MSFTQIIQFFGPGGVPVGVFGAVLGLFELGERLATQRAKDALSAWLLAFDVRKAGALPEGTKELFERIFGERHFSLKCFVRSALFSLGAMAFISILSLLVNPHPSEVFDTEMGAWEAIFNSRFPFWVNWIPFVIWLPLSIVADYISLFKTRFILRLLLRIHRRTTIVAIASLIMDYIVYVYIFFLGTSLAGTLSIVIGAFVIGVESAFWHSFGISVYFSISTFPAFVSWLLPELSGFRTLWFWAGFAPSIWMWLYVLALFVTRLLLRSEKLVNWLRWALDFEKNPFRSIGAVAATLAFIASVAVLLVSAEISNISSALEGPTDQQQQRQESTTITAPAINNPIARRS